MRCVVDCRENNKFENNYLGLNLWGKPCFAYVIDAVEDSGCFSNIEILSNSRKIYDYCGRHYPKYKISTGIKERTGGEAIFDISGRAPCISSSTISAAVNSFNGEVMISSKSMPVYSFAPGMISSYVGSEQQRFYAFTIWEGGY